MESVIEATQSVVRNGQAWSWAWLKRWLGGVMVIGVGLVINRLRHPFPAVHCWV